MQEVGLRDVLNQINARLNHLEQRMIRLEERMFGLEARVEERITGLEARMDAKLATKADKWEVRIWFTSVLALLGAILGTVITRL